MFVVVKTSPDSNKMATGLVMYLNDWFQKEIDNKKTDKAKTQWKERRDALVNKVVMNKDQLVAMFSLMKILVELKGMVIAQFDKTQEVDTLLRTAKGFQVTRQEGFVAIDKLRGGAVKLVDRLEFSKANFSPEILKGWQK
jgi:phenylalanine-4-hydroxylase